MPYSIKRQKNKNEKSMDNFIQENKSEIDSYILSKSPNNRLDDDERELWIMNDEGLYLWAKREGVDI